MNDAGIKNNKISSLTGFWLQVGFAEGVVAEGQAFNNLQAALAHIFFPNKESTILLFNSIPVCFSYRSDLPIILPDLLHCLNTLQLHTTLHNYEFNIKTQNVEATWHFDLHENMMSVYMDWLRVKGGYQAALNVFGKSSYDKHIFINEWLMLLKQCQQCLTDAGAILIGQAGVDRELLNTVESKMTSFGRLYQRLNTQLKQE